MPKQKTHKGLAKRIKVTKTGKVRFFSPNSRHLKSNKRGTTVQTYRKARFARDGDTKMFGKLLNRGLLSQQQHKRKQLEKATVDSVAGSAAVSKAPSKTVSKAASKATPKVSKVEKAAKSG